MLFVSSAVGCRHLIVGSLLAVGIFVLLLTDGCYGHGGMVEPPMRSVMWRYNFDTPVNYDWNSLYCGGFHVFQQAGGKCGLCGDPHNGPFHNDKGGMYDNGIIVRHYPAGLRQIEVKIEITAFHRGYFTFKLCPNDARPLSQACLDRYPLDIAEGREQGNPRQYFPTDGARVYELRVELPRDVTCDRCVLQWTYTAGNSHGRSADGRSCLGCGLQETFVNCADISIGGTVDNIPVDKTALQPTGGDVRPDVTIPDVPVPTGPDGGREIDEFVTFPDPRTPPEPRQSRPEVRPVQPNTPPVQNIAPPVRPGQQVPVRSEPRLPPVEDTPRLISLFQSSGLVDRNDRPVRPDSVRSNPTRSAAVNTGRSIFPPQNLLSVIRRQSQLAKRTMSSVRSSDTGLSHQVNRLSDRLRAPGDVTGAQMDVLVAHNGMTSPTDSHDTLLGTLDPAVKELERQRLSRRRTAAAMAGRLTEDFPRHPSLSTSPRDTSLVENVHRMHDTRKLAQRFMGTRRPPLHISDHLPHHRAIQTSRSRLLHSQFHPSIQRHVTGGAPSLSARRHLPRRIVVHSIPMAKYLLRRHPHLQGRVFLSQRAHMRSKYGSMTHMYRKRRLHRG